MIMSPDRASRTVPLASGLRRGGWSGADRDERSGIYARGGAAARGSGGPDHPGSDAVAGRELPAGEAADGALSRARSSGVGARQHRAAVESGDPPRVSRARRRAGADALWGGGGARRRGGGRPGGGRGPAWGPALAAGQRGGDQGVLVRVGARARWMGGARVDTDPNTPWSVHS